MSCAPSTRSDPNKTLTESFATGSYIFTLGTAEQLWDCEGRGGGGSLLTRFWNGGGLRHLFLLTLCNFKILGGTCQPPPLASRSTHVFGLSVYKYNVCVICWNLSNFWEMVRGVVQNWQNFTCCKGTPKLATMFRVTWRCRKISKLSNHCNSLDVWDVLRVR